MDNKKQTPEVIAVQEVTVYLNEPEAAMFVEFQKHYPTIEKLLNARVFEQKGAAITLHFDKLGVLRNVTRADVLYDHRSNFQNLN